MKEAVYTCFGNFQRSNLNFVNLTNNQRVKVRTPTNAHTVPADRSRRRAEVWEGGESEP